MNKVIVYIFFIYILFIVKNIYFLIKIFQKTCKNFLTAWPRNFCVVLWFELLIVQPLGRAVMKLIHTKKVPQKVKVDKIQNLDEPE